MPTRRDRGAALATPHRSPGRQAPTGPNQNTQPRNRPDLTPTGLHALQRSAGNRAVAHALGGRRQIQRTDSGGTQTQVSYRMQIQVQKSSRTHERAYLSGQAFGHAWVALYQKEGEGEQWKSYGFFPDGEIPPHNPLKTVKGSVRRNFDQPGGATTKLTADLTEEQYNKAKEYINANQAHDYNLATYNCTSFARGVYRAATGKSAPGLGLPLLENPNLLQDSMKRRNERSGKPRPGDNIEADMGPASGSSSSDDETSYGPPLGGLVEYGVGAATQQQPPAAPTPGRFEID